MDALLNNFFNIEIFQQVFPFLLRGLTVTIGLSALVIPVGLIGGLAVALLATQSSSRTVRTLIAVYVDVFRALPPLVLLIFIYFGFPFLNIDLPKLMAVALGFLLNNAAYYGEIFRACRKARWRLQDRRALRAAKPWFTSSSRRPCAMYSPTCSATALKWSS